MTIHEKFTKDMVKAGIKVCEYQGRNFWTGPSIHVESWSRDSALASAREFTKVPLQCESLGKGFVVYPQARANVPLRKSKA